MDTMSKTQKCWDCLGYFTPGTVCECKTPASAAVELPELECLEPDNCPDDATGMPCNNCHTGAVDRLEELFTLVREAMVQTANTNYLAGRYAGGGSVTADEVAVSRLHERSAVSRMWSAMYAAADSTDGVL